MNQGRERQLSPLDDQIEGRIDRTLRFIGSVQPRPGLEKRIAARLAHAPAHAAARRSSRFLAMQRIAIASAAGLAASVAIIAGSVNHSRRLLPIAPGMQLPGSPSSAVGAASAKAIAQKPVTPPANGRPRSVRKTSRVASATEAQRPGGVVLPRNPPQP